MHFSSWQERAGVQAKTLPQPEAPRGGPHRRIRLLPRPWPGAGPGLGVRGRLTVCAGRTSPRPAPTRAPTPETASTEAPTASAVTARTAADSPPAGVLANLSRGSPRGPSAPRAGPGLGSRPTSPPLPLGPGGAAWAGVRRGPPGSALPAHIPDRSAATRAPAPQPPPAPSAAGPGDGGARRRRRQGDGVDGVGLPPGGRLGPAAGPPAAKFPESRLGARPGSWPAAPSAPAPRSVDVVLRPPRLGAMGDPPKRKPGTALCVGCGSRIHDQFLLRVSPDLEWHAACLKCAECSQYLDETCTCFVRDGKTYCKRDYARLFGIKCAKCQVGFSSSDLVMRARDRVYHVECFRCSVCSRQLLPGDEFSLREHELLCRADHGLLLERAAAGSPHSPGPLPGARGLHLPEPAAARQPSLRPHVHKPAEKTTRVRTVLNEKQLHTLRTCYAANPRPDALMKEQLVEMTGLSPRVIRVWFQNKRCKDKKKSILMKQLQQQQHNDKTSLQGLTGTPLVAGSPIRHESAVQGSAVEVQTYQPPWKALSEFALQSDLDQPAFQQLVSFSESGSLGNSSGSDVTSLSSQLPDTPNSMVPSPVET
ncbi:insulin gene enhancer protein ISL-2 isoform X1 [Canis lupus familiaris]|uniref:insulin gene enhancer protein ISL-2 isoform X1 n=1 Tax=Canis lupus familiaris TaxID=9615 RepID=UPI0018F7D30A|nr:insulin gene enhancer protein ISL-2 isoform X1 [Canis lupus familiaris]